MFTDSPLPMLDAEADHRRHAIIEQVIADLKSGPLAHLPSGRFAANAAWLVLAAIAFNLTRAAGTLASPSTPRRPPPPSARHLIAVAARLARSARRLILHLPRDWPWQHAWQHLFTAADRATRHRLTPDHPPKGPTRKNPEGRADRQPQRARTEPAAARDQPR